MVLIEPTIAVLWANAPKSCALTNGFCVIICQSVPSVTTVHRSSSHCQISTVCYATISRRWQRI